MKKLNIKKLKLNKSSVNSLNSVQMKVIKGGDEGVDTGFSMCIETATRDCCAERPSYIPPPK